MSLDTLDVGAELGDGGQGKVFEVHSHPTMVLKTYHDQMTVSFRPDALSDLMEIGGLLSCNGLPVQQWAAWPEARVTAGGRVVGFLMPRVPQNFTVFVGGKLRLANLSYLAARPAPIWGPVDLPASDERLAILASLAAVMEVLHDQELVIGDLSFGNILWTRAPARVMLIDCDGIHRENGPSAMPQADTIDWADPLGASQPPDRDRDRYKLSLAVIRVLTQDLSATPGQAGQRPLSVPEERQGLIRQLLERAAGPRGTRPTAREWRMALGQRAMRPVAQPLVRPASTLPPKPELLIGDGVSSRQIRPVTPPAPPT